MSTIRALLVSALTTLGGLSALGWLLKAYIDRKLQYAFKKREMLFERSLRTTDKYVEHIQDIRLKAAPEIHEVAYRIRNKFREDFGRWSDEDISEASELSDQLVDCLYRYRIFLPPETFSLLHRYKDIVQRLVVHLSQGSGLPSSTQRQRREKLMALTSSDTKLVDELFLGITVSLKELMQPSTEVEAG